MEKSRETLDDDEEEDDVELLEYEEKVSSSYLDPYLYSSTIKIMTDGDTMAAAVVAFNSLAETPNELFRTSEVNVQEVAHSSVVSLNVPRSFARNDYVKNEGFGGHGQYFSTYNFEYNYVYRTLNYWLSAEDLVDASRLLYGIDRSEIEIFPSIGNLMIFSQSLANKILLMKKQGVTTRTILLNFSSYHWVTCVPRFDYSRDRVVAYYIDSQGQPLPDDYRRAFILSGITDIHDMSYVQQDDSYNCGLWALINAEQILNLLSNHYDNGKAMQEIIKQTTYNYSRDHFRNLRDRLFRLFRDDFVRRNRFLDVYGPAELQLRQMI